MLKYFKGWEVGSGGGGGGGKGKGTPPAGRAS